MMKKFYGKSIDIAKLKPHEVNNKLDKELNNVKETVQQLKRLYVQVEQSQCYICATTSTSAIPFAEIYGFQYVHCAKCNHLYTTSRYNTEDLIKFYKENERYSSATYSDLKSYRYRIDHVDRPKLAFLEKFSKKGKLIDAGSGIGGLVYVAKENGWDAVSVEVSKYSVKFGKEQLNAPLIRK